jgi:hypothetical protein
MAIEIASSGEAAAPGFRLKLPGRIPDFGPRSYLLFQLVWFAAFALALLGPIAGTWHRIAEADRNSALVAGSRAGIALAEDDLTRIRFPVGPAAAAAGIRAGDEIVAIDTIPLSPVVAMPGSAAAAAGAGNETDQLLLGDLLSGAEDRDILLRLRSPGGREREVSLGTGEGPYRAGRASARDSPRPAELHRPHPPPHLPLPPRLRLAALPAQAGGRGQLRRLACNLADDGDGAALGRLPGARRRGAGGLHQAIYDLANICLIGGILLFPHGRLAPHAVFPLLALLPALFFLEGDLYRSVLMAYMTAAVAILLWRLRTAGGDERQQLKWAVFGFAGYALFLAVMLVADMLKPGAPSLGQQLLLEVAAGFAFAFAFLLLQAGLLVALLRYRLYDAEVAISRSASFALIAIILAGIFAATMEGVKEVILRLFGQDAGSIAPIVGAALSTVMINPIYERVQHWAEGRFHRRLAQMRRDLPDCLRDLSHFASLPELVEEVLGRVAAGVRSARLALVLDGRVAGCRGTTPGEVEAWLARTALDPSCSSGVETHDPFFPLRRPLSPDDGTCLGWILLGPHPDRSRLSTAELDALDALAQPVARAIRVVLARQAREAEIAEALARQQRQIDALALRLPIDPAGSAA